MRPFPKRREDQRPRRPVLFSSGIDSLRVINGLALAISLVLMLLLAASAALAQSVHIATTYTTNQGVAPRLQWNANDGYCGEVSFISAGLRFGQYCSQYTARRIASPSYRQTQRESWLLLGATNADSAPPGRSPSSIAAFAARRMRLSAVEFPDATQATSFEFVNWIKDNFLSGRVVIIGVFYNGIALGDWTRVGEGDPEYDHIVPVLRIGSDAPFDDFPGVFLRSDTITISDNGLYGLAADPADYQYVYSYRFPRFLGTRAQANRPTGPIYLLKNRPANYGIAIAGPLDIDNVTIPVVLEAGRNSEPEMQDGSDLPPAPVPLQLSATVHIPDSSKAWNVYCYTNFDDVPVANFNDASNSAARIWHYPAEGPAVATKKTITVNTNTAATIVFRAVPATAP